MTRPGAVEDSRQYLMPYETSYDAPSDRDYYGDGEETDEEDFQEQEMSISPDHRAEIKASLLALLSDLLRRKRDLSVPSEIESMDRANEVARMESEATFAEEDNRKLKAVRNALFDIENEYWGACVECGKQIGIRRLRAVPWATECVPCKDIKEKK